MKAHPIIIKIQRDQVLRTDGDDGGGDVDGGSDGEDFLIDIISGMKSVTTLSL
jgi:hypothetical protein